MSSVLLEPDALVMVNVDDACFDFIIADCISLLKEIPNCSVSFVRRSTNQVTHVLT